MFNRRGIDGDSVERLWWTNLPATFHDVTGRKLDEGLLRTARMQSGGAINDMFRRYGRRRQPVKKLNGYRNRIFELLLTAELEREHLGVAARRHARTAAELPVRAEAGLRTGLVTIGAQLALEPVMARSGVMDAAPRIREISGFARCDTRCVLHAHAAEAMVEAIQEHHDKRVPEDDRDVFHELYGAPPGQIWLRAAELLTGREDAAVADKLSYWYAKVDDLHVPDRLARVKELSQLGRIPHEAEACGRTAVRLALAAAEPGATPQPAGEQFLDPTKEVAGAAGAPTWTGTSTAPATHYGPGQGGGLVR